MGKIGTMKIILNSLYRIFLMPYFERDRYFEELCDETEKECDTIALEILSEQYRKK
jgi:hypothetical protein